MILREIQIQNFRQITGSQKISLAQPGDNCLTVILGENASGKTTLIQACLWCLYGKKDFENPTELASYHAVANLPADETTTTVRVRLVFDARGHRYTAERSIDFEQESDGSLAAGETQFHVMTVDPSGETRPCDDPTALIKQLLPEELAGFFFFRGEDLNELVAQSGADKLKSAVEEFIDLKLVDRSIHHLELASKEFEKQLKQKSSGEVRRLTEEIAAIESELESLNAKYENQQEKRTKLNKQYESVENELQNYNEIRPIVEKKRELKLKIEGLDKRIASQEAEVARILSPSGFLWLNPSIINDADKLTQEAVATGELPAKIKPQFVDDLLDDGECICGRTLEEPERQILRAWRNHNQLASIESAVLGLRGNLNSFRARIDQFEGDIESARDVLAELRDEHRRAVAEHSSLASKLEGSERFEVDAARLQALLREFSEHLANLGHEMGVTAQKRSRLSETLDAKLDQRTKAAGKEAAARLSAQRAESTRKVANAFREIREGWVGLVQDYLDVELKRNWREMAQLDRLVSFDNNFRLSIRERGANGDWVASATSAANQRALALGFVGSLIRLASEAANSEDSQFFAGGDYPLVMDAPFATMDDYFKGTVPRGLLKTVPQLVIINSLDQWEGTVANSLASAVGRVYVLELHGPEVEPKTGQFHTTHFNYKVRENGAAYDWTVIKEVEL